MEGCVLLYQLCRCRPKLLSLEINTVCFCIRRSRGPAVQLDNEELNFPDLPSLGELGTPVAQ